MTYILALDQGTSSSRAILFDRQGQICAMAQQEFTQHFPRPGWIEHDPNEIWSSQLTVARAVIQEAGIGSGDISGIGIANQRETTLLWDRATSEPLGRAIVWQDRRTASHCDRLREQGHESMFQEKTGLILDSYFSGTKLSWMLDHLPNARERANRGELAFGTVDSWLVWKLSGGDLHITDPSNASRTLLFDIRRGSWDDQLLSILDVPRGVLAEVRSSSEVYGHTREDLFGTPIPIAGIAGDQQAALFGQMCIDRGMLKTTYGTGCFMLLTTGDRLVRSSSNLLTTVAWRIGGQTTYALEGSIFIGGAVVQWLRDGLGLIKSSAEIESLAAGVPDNGGVYLVPAFTGLGSPLWDPHARGTVMGLTRGTTAGHLARAALESIAYQVVDVLDAMQTDAGLRVQEMRVDGGASANNLLMQFQADVFGCATVRPRCIETTALGVAYLAGLAVGYFDDLGQIARQWQVDRRFDRTLSESDIRQFRAGWAKALQRAVGWADS